MSLVDEIMSQQVILIGVGMAFLFIIAAIGAAIYPRLKDRRAKLIKRKAEEKAAQELARQEAKAAAQAARGGRRKSNVEAVAPAAPGTESGAKAPAVAVATATPAAPIAPKPAAAPLVSAATTTTATKEEVTPEMQDLLSSVFSDEENSERQAILLKGMESISIDELLTLTKAVAAQLRGEQPANLVRVKENQLS